MCDTHVGGDDESLRPSHDAKPVHKTAKADKAPKSDSMLTFLRQWLASVAEKHVGSSGTHYLRRSAAQALIGSGWKVEAVKFFGRWLRSAVELHLLQMPMRAFGHPLTCSMAGVIAATWRMRRWVHRSPVSGPCWLLAMSSKSSCLDSF